MRAGIKILFVALVLLPLCYLAFSRACSTQPTTNTNDDAVQASYGGTSANANRQALVAQTNKPTTSTPELFATPAPFPSTAEPAAAAESATRATEGRERRARQSREPLLEQMSLPAAARELPRLEATPAATTATSENDSVQIAAITTPTVVATPSFRESRVPPTIQYSEDSYRSLTSPRIPEREASSETARRQALSSVVLPALLPAENVIIRDFLRVPASVSAREETNDEIARLEEMVSRASEAAARDRHLESVGQSVQSVTAEADSRRYLPLLKEVTELDLRGLQRYTAALNVTDKDARDARLEAAKRDFSSAVELTAKAFQIMDVRPPSNEAERTLYDGDTNLALAIRAQALRLYVSKVDRSQVETARTAFADYIAAEPDAAKRSTAQHALAQMLLDAGAFSDAFSAYAEILTKNPDDLEALGNSGMALFSLGTTEEQMGKPEGADHYYRLAEIYLNRFLRKAPSTNELTQGAIVALAELERRSGGGATRTASPAERLRNAPAASAIPSSPPASPPPSPKRP